MKLVVDFDDVVFDTASLKKATFSVLSEIGINNGEELYRSTRAFIQPFSLKQFLLLVCGEIGRSEDVNRLYELIMKDCQSFVNESMVSILKEIGKENCYIVTQSDEEYQKDKVTRTGLQDLVQEVIIVSGSKKEAIESLCAYFPSEEIIFVDDKQKFFDDIDMKKCKNLRTILYNENGLSALKSGIEASRKVRRDDVNQQC